MDIHSITRLNHNFYAAHDDYYWERFFYFLYESGGYHKKAYELIEEEYFEKYGINRFTSYESFRVGKHRRLCGGKIKECHDPNQLELF